MQDSINLLQRSRIHSNGHLCIWNTRWPLWLKLEPHGTTWHKSNYLQRRRNLHFLGPTWPWCLAPWTIRSLLPLPSLLCPQNQQLRRFHLCQLLPTILHCSAILPCFTCPGISWGASNNIWKKYKQTTKHASIMYLSQTPWHICQ